MNVLFAQFLSLDLCPHHKNWVDVKVEVRPLLRNSHVEGLLLSLEVEMTSIQHRMCLPLNQAAVNLTVSFKLRFLLLTEQWYYLVTFWCQGVTEFKLVLILARHLNLIQLLSHLCLCGWTSGFKKAYKESLWKETS